MTDFKVGDRVRVTDPKNNDRYFKKGAEGTVIRVEVGDLCIRFTAGDYDTDCDGCWWANPAWVEKIVPYSSTFTQSAHVGAPQGHTADGGGLQKHSIGGIYPLCVVGYHNGDTPVVWVVENLQDGTVACTSSGQPRQWKRIDLANDFAVRCKEHTTDNLGAPIVWLKGRPQFGVEARLSRHLSMNTAQG